MKKLWVVIFILFGLTRCGELQQIARQLPSTEAITNADIAKALKEALHQGIDKEVESLMKAGGFYNQPDVRILLPDELKKVDEALRKIGLGNLADEGIKKLNAAAEKAVKEAKPIFVQAIREMTFEDARKILMGDQNAATRYLENKTRQSLYRKFYPIVKQSFHQVGADDIWNKIISKYNSIPFVKPVNSDLNDYVTRQALNGVFKKIADEEIKIRTDFKERTTELLKKVFALQDNKN